MTVSMYQASVPVFVRALANLAHVLKKGEAHAQAKGFAPEVLLQTRLYPDMFPLTRQVQIATDMVKNGAARLAAIEAPKFEDNESSFAELYARLDRAIAFLNSLKPEQIDGSEARTITVPRRSGPLTLQGQPYLLDYVFPNFFFHCTTAYAILRHCGVEIGKTDFIGAF